MKKILFICLLISSLFGIAQEKKISFTKELNYQMTNKNTSSVMLKIYASNNNEFLTKVVFNDIPLYYYTDGLGTSAVSPEISSRLTGSFGLNSLLYGPGGSYDYEDKDEYTLETQKLDTRETILGMPCSHYLITYRSKDGNTKDDNLKLCIDDKSVYNNFSVLNGLLNQYEKRARLKGFGIKGLILKAGPEKTYDQEYFALTSMKDSKDFVLFDHKKAMTEQQRKLDSITMAYRNQQEVYADSAVAVVDSVTAPSLDSDYYGIPDYVSEYKRSKESEGLAISTLSNDKLWKGLPKHCRNFEKDLPVFNNQELQKHLKNYVGQMCDMYLTQSYGNTVSIKITLDEIRREVLYFNEIHDKLNQSDQKKLTTYLQNLD